MSSFGWFDEKRGTVAAALGVLVTLTALVAFFDVGQRPFLTAALLVLFAGAFLFALWATWNASPSRGVLLGVAVLLRLVALDLPPTLSDDVYRYIWDGRVLVAGFNPYTEAPDASRLAELRDELWQRMPPRGVETVYPPLALAFFSIAGLATHPVLAWKAMILVAEALSCWLLLGLVARRRLPTGRAVGYLWSPLVVIESTGMGHVDALGVLPLLAALVLVDRGSADRERRGSSSLPRTVGAALLLCASVLTKLVPLLLVPLWTKLSTRPRAFGAAFLVGLGAVLLPVLFTSGGLPPGLVTYGTSWEFNGPLFEPLWRLINTVRLDSAVKLLLGLGVYVGLSEILEPLYRYVYPQFLARLFLMLMLFWVVVRSTLRQQLMRGSLDLLTAMILFSATVYPWYLLWALPFACLTGRKVWLLLSVSLLAVYTHELFDVELFPWTYLLVWMPPLLYRLSTGREDKCSTV